MYCKKMVFIEYILYPLSVPQFHISFGSFEFEYNWKAIFTYLEIIELCFIQR